MRALYPDSFSKGAILNLSGSLGSRSGGGPGGSQSVAADASTNAGAATKAVSPVLVAS